jgi:Protein of unknown function (DUF2877)
MKPFSARLEPTSSNNDVMTATVSQPRSVKAEWFGAMIPELIGTDGIWTVVQRYRNCFYAVSQDRQVICIANRLVGRGPFTINIAATDCPIPAATTGSTFRALARRLLLGQGGLVLDLEVASQWRATFTDINDSREALTTDLGRLMNKAASLAPRESIGALIPALLSDGPAPCPDPAGDRLTNLLHLEFFKVVNACRAIGPVADSAAWMDMVARKLNPLIGRGYGLTPSGDDFCAGFLLGLIKFKLYQEANQLSQILYEAARGKTTHISLAFYRSLAAGLLSESQTRFLSCFADHWSTGRDQAMDAFCSQGGTSGWDTLAGLVFGIEQARAYKHIRTPEIAQEALC